MKITTLLILSIFTLISCSNKKPFEERFKTQKFDKEVIKRIKLYDTLRLYLTHHMKQIFKTPAPVEIQTANFNYCDCNIVSKGKQIPDTIINAISPILKQIGYNYLFKIEIDSDSTFTAYVKNKYLPDFNLDVRERLIWRKDPNQIIIDKYKVKHTIINTNWDYMIWYDKRMGILK